MRPQTSKVKALSGGEGLLRWREGQYRLVYRIDDAVLEVLVVRVGHRREVYER
ncbi:MAG: type II toxin-antitoxin system RelE family toxin [Egibacteraceae bacterium]